MTACILDSLCEQVHVWQIPLAGDAVPDLNDMACLSIEEKQRGARFINPQDQNRFWQVHACLRMILSRYLKVSPDSLAFFSGPHGKPYLKNASINLQFNLSHSGDQALLAVGLNDELGVDIEQIKQPIEWQGLAQRFFSPAEQSYLLALPKKKQLNGFYQIWARKEAYIKATGLGLSDSLDSFSVVANQKGETVIKNWLIIDLDAPIGYACALANRPVASIIEKKWFVR